MSIAYLKPLYGKASYVKNKDNICLNCEFKLTGEKYCPNCGQKANLLELNLKYILSSFLGAFINFDLKFIRSLKDIWIPNKISNNFLSGSRAVYVNHLRFYFICLVIFFGLVSLNLRHIDTFENHLEKKATLLKAKQTFDTLKQNFTLDCEAQVFDSLENQLFKDDLEADESYIHVNDRKYSYYDIYNLSTDSLLAKHNVTAKWEKFTTPQIIKAMKNGTSVFKFVLSNMIWGIIFLTMIMALFLKIIYFRHKSFYAEHLMQMINFHCIFLLISSIFLLTNLISEIELGNFISIAFVLGGLHLTYSLKLYYHQGWIKTFIKSFLILIAYVLAVSFVGLIILLISIILY